MNSDVVNENVQLVIVKLLPEIKGKSLQKCEKFSNGTKASNKKTNILEKSALLVIFIKCIY